ncbi:MAG: aminoacyl-tRNA hydrolase [Flavobacteriaceae bacterium]|nr:aminoacyl-tRNA hydrolase [Flavobacteriaceae bacterium]
MDFNVILEELQFRAVRSSGPGGQHVNKTSSKVELRFDLMASEGLSEEEKEGLLSKSELRLTSKGILVLQSGESRSQHRNKKIVMQRLQELLTEYLVVPKARKPSKPSKKTIEKRLDQKKQHSQKKANRKPPKLPG